MRLIDAHTHLNTNPLFEDRMGYLQKFIEAGGVGLVNSGASESYNMQGIAIAKNACDKSFLTSLSQGRNLQDIIVKTTLGFHPEECVEGNLSTEDISAKIQWLKDLYVANKEYVVAIGETGIDLYYPGSLATLEMQKELFVQHCNLAQELDLPLVIHSRDAFKETLEILKNYNNLTVYFHCWGYGPEEYRLLHAELLSLHSSLFIGFCGNVTYKKADILRETLKIVPLDSLLLETDAPYLAPQILRGEINHPANVKYIYEFVADYLQLDKELLAHQVEQNFKRLYLDIL